MRFFLALTALIPLTSAAFSTFGANTEGPVAGRAKENEKPFNGPYLIHKRQQGSSPAIVKRVDHSTGDFRTWTEALTNSEAVTDHFKRNAESTHRPWPERNKVYRTTGVNATSDEEVAKGHEKGPKRPMKEHPSKPPSIRAPNPSITVARRPRYTQTRGVAPRNTIPKHRVIGQPRKAFDLPLPTVDPPAPQRPRNTHTLVDPNEIPQLSWTDSLIFKNKTDVDDLGHLVRLWDEKNYKGKAQWYPERLIHWQNTPCISYPAFPSSFKSFGPNWQGYQYWCTLYDHIECIEEGQPDYSLVDVVGMAFYPDLGQLEKQPYVDFDDIIQSIRCYRGPYNCVKRGTCWI